MNSSDFTTQDLDAPSTAIFYQEKEHINYIHRLTQEKPSDPSHLIGGVITAVNSSLTHVPIDPTLRNAELFHYCKSDQALASR